MRALTVLTLLVADGCAHAPQQLDRLEQQVHRSCDALKDGSLRAAVRTDVAGGLKSIQATFRAGDRAGADRLARELSHECYREVERRRDLAAVLKTVEERRDSIEPRFYQHLQRLVSGADYDSALLCAEGLAEGNPGRCDLAPAVPARTAPIPIGVTTPSPVQPPAQEPEEESPPPTDDP